MNRLPGKTKKSVRFRALPPLSGASQAVESKGACAPDRTDNPALENVGAYFNYAPPETISSGTEDGKNPRNEGAPTHLDGVFPISQPGNVPLRSKPVAIAPVTRTVYDRKTGESATANLYYVDGAVDSLNEAVLDPNRFVQIPLRGEFHPLPAR